MFFCCFDRPASGRATSRKCGCERPTFEQWPRSVRRLHPWKARLAWRRSRRSPTGGLWRGGERADRGGVRLCRLLASVQGRNPTHLQVRQLSPSVLSVHGEQDGHSTRFESLILLCRRQWPQRPSTTIITLNGSTFTTALMLRWRRMSATVRIFLDSKVPP